MIEGHGGRVTMTNKERATLLAWMDGNSNYYGSFDYTPHATCESFKLVANQLKAEMKAQGCVACHKQEVGNDWVNLQTPRFSRILRAPLAGVIQTSPLRQRPDARSRVTWRATRSACESIADA